MHVGKRKINLPTAGATSTPTESAAAAAAATTSDCQRGELNLHCLHDTGWWLGMHCLLACLPDHNRVVCVRANQRSALHAGVCALRDRQREREYVLKTKWLTLNGSCTCHLSLCASETAAVRSACVCVCDLITAKWDVNMAEATCNRMGEEEWGNERERTKKGEEGGRLSLPTAGCAR